VCTRKWVVRSSPADSHRGRLLAAPLPAERGRRHRSTNQAWFRETLQSGQDVLLVSIASEHTLTDLEGYLRSGDVTLGRLRVLTFDPTTPDVVFDSVSRHLGEPLVRLKEQICRAHQRWRQIEQEHSFVKVLTYSSAPTLQAVFRGDEACDVEFFTYSTPPSERASLFVQKGRNPVAFRLFKNACESLWNEAEKKTRGGPGVRP